MTALFLAVALALDPGVGVEPFADPPTVEQADALTEELAKNLRCPVCQGLSVQDSSADAAVAMKARIRELVEQGYTEDQVVDYFIERYGEWVLLEPKVETNLAIYVLPAIAIVIALAMLAGRIRKREDEAPAAAAPVASTDALADDPYAARVLAELDD